MIPTASVPSETRPGFARDSRHPHPRQPGGMCPRATRAAREAWSSTGQHHARGPMTIGQLVDEFLVNHAEEHAVQIQASVKSLAGARR